MFSNPSIERRYTPREALPQHKFTNFVPPSNPTEGVTPNLGFIESNLQKHPDFPQALKLLLESWWDKKINPHNDQRWDLYSYGERVATATLDPASLLVSVDLPSFRAKEDLNWQSFQELVLINIALHAGNQERLQAQPGEYEYPPFTTTIPSRLFSSQAIVKLSAEWEGNQQMVYSTQENDGTITQHKSGSFDLIDGKDKDLRLSFTTFERVLSLDGKEIARLVFRHTPQPGNLKELPDNETPIPLPVISQPEVVVTGSSEEERYRNLEFIIHRLTELSKMPAQDQQQQKETQAAPKTETAVFTYPTPTQEIQQAAG